MTEYNTIVTKHNKLLEVKRSLENELINIPRKGLDKATETMMTNETTKALEKVQEELRECFETLKK